MNQTKQEAAETYGRSLDIDRVRFSSGEIEAMREEATRDFIAGAEWHRQNLLSEGGNVILPYHEWASMQIKWISTKSERKPNNMQKVLILVRSVFSGEKEISTFTYTERMGMSETTVIAWAEIPDSLLNFKP